MNLKQGTLLQGGKYRIERELGHGGFGITYLATQVGLNRKVAIKEFFMRECCARDGNTSNVLIGFEGCKEPVAKYRTKFVKEVQTIAGIDNCHIVRIYDIFEENETAYYVMEYLAGGDLKSRIPSGGIPEMEAIGYIRNIADTLRYIYTKNVFHFNINPANILFRNEEEMVLIDFGISKQHDRDDIFVNEFDDYDFLFSNICHGFSPLEQYRIGQSCSLTTAIYSIGATLYYMLTGCCPPEAIVLLEEGLPMLPSHVSAGTCTAVRQAMQPRYKDRLQTVEEFLELLGIEDCKRLI